MLKMFTKMIGLVLPLLVALNAFAAFEGDDQVQGVHFLEAWSMEGAKKVQAPSPVSDLVGVQDWQTIMGTVPEKCKNHLIKETEQLKTLEYDANAWMAHVAVCKCCGPVLAGVFAAHVNNMAKLPHTVVFFDYDSASLTADNRERLRTFLANHKKENRRFLLIGRASRTITVEHPLDYLRDHSLYNLRLSEKRTIAVRNFMSPLLFDQEPAPNQLYDLIPIRMFGMADPQIDPDYVNKYSIKPWQWQDSHYKGEDPEGFYRLNQSVVVIAFDGELREDFQVGAPILEPVSYPYTGQY